MQNDIPAAQNILCRRDVRTELLWEQPDTAGSVLRRFEIFKTAYFII